MEKVCPWFMDETKGADFGDKRLPSRFSQLLYNLSHAPDKSIPSSNKGWSETLAAYRFIDHHKITPQKILLPHREATLSRIQNERVVLIPQDTTDIDLSNRKKRYAGLEVMKQPRLLYVYLIVKVIFMMYWKSCQMKKIKHFG